ncbi:unnamed protein product [Cylindrotheca closterium]|uniref:Uncharacterized protein n=1 Tax=Cylindrotheca closterium TaxID=2856 RepID=A0AAD2GE93_9STRA|nr:unnamed protein product [Cylindrotheca closterium]
MGPATPTTPTSTSIITTTSTTTTTTTPLKVVDKSKKVEETLQTTTTTTKTTTTTPVKEEIKKNIIVNKVWNDCDSIRGQLFRDLCFGRYGSDTAATEIHRDAERDYSQYNLQTIQRKVRELRIFVKAYHRGVWLDEMVGFKELCRLDQLPTDEEKKGREEEYNRFEKLHPIRKVPSKRNNVSTNDLDELFGEFIALSVKSGAVKV